MQRPPHRDQRFTEAETALIEYFARVEAGEALSFVAWLEGHAEIADELRELHSMCTLLKEPSGTDGNGVAATNGSPQRDGVSELEQLRCAANRFDEYELDTAPIAEGGMGTVFAARDRTLGRRLAIKVLRDDHRQAHASARRIARFLAEARVTSQLDHPGIVPVYEVGTDALGRPYFAMKRVSGETLERVLERVAAGDADWSQARALTVLERVCEAVAFAHENGVVHRDLKPSNVMVGGFGEVYVVDWGLARVVDRRGGERVVAGAAEPAHDGEDSDAFTTLAGEVLGTPTYMAPEQALGLHDEVGRQSDVYSVGAMLYQLLARQAPYANAGEPCTSRIVLARVAAGPPKSLRQIARDVPPELIAICEKAMQRDWRERYRDMAALSQDLSAFLRGRVVGAYEAGAWAQARKWVARNRSLAAALAFALVFLIGGAVTSLVYAGEARRQSVIAREHARDAVRNSLAADAARTLADANAEDARRNEVDARESETEARASEQRAKRVTEFVQAALIRSDPNQGGTQDYLVSDAMDQALAELERGALADDPATEASLQSTIVRILIGNGRPADALEIAERALATRQTLFARAHPDLCNGYNEVACCLQALGRDREALPMLEAALSIMEELHEGDDRGKATCINNLALCLNGVGRSAEALPMHRSALEMRRRLLGGDHIEIAQSLNNLGLCLGSSRNHGESLREFEAALDMHRRLHDGDHPYLVTSLNNVALTLVQLDRSAEALPMFEESLAMSRALYGEDHPSTAMSLSGTASCLGGLGRHAEALPKHEAALQIRQRLFAGDHPHVAVGLHNVAACLEKLGRRGEALVQFEAALVMTERLYPQGHPSVATCLRSAATCFVSLGRHAEALPRFVKALDVAQRCFGEADPTVVGAWLDVARCHGSLGARDEALSYAEQAAIYAQLLEPDHSLRKICESELLKFEAAVREAERATKESSDP